MGLGRAAPDRGRDDGRGQQGQARRQRGRGDRPAQRIRLCDRGRGVPGLAAGPAPPGLEQLDGAHFDIPAPLRTIQVVLARGAPAPGGRSLHRAQRRPDQARAHLLAAGQPGSRGPVRDLAELSTASDEGVPGHHLQIGAAKTAGDKLSRFAKSAFVSGHGEGWALYAERLADELGWFTEPGTRLDARGWRSGPRGWSSTSASTWTCRCRTTPGGASKACEVLATAGHGEPHRIHAEVVRYFGWPPRPSPTSWGSAPGGGPGRRDATPRVRPDLPHRRAEPGPDRPGRPADALAGVGTR